MSTPPQAEEVCALFHETADIMRSQSSRVGACVHLPAQGRVVIAGDLHDHLTNWVRILQTANLGPESNHLIIQELIHGPSLIHGCDMSWRMLARVAEQVRAHPGQVHPLLGNHENSQLTGVGVTKGGGNSVELFTDGIAMTFGDAWPEVESAINAFLEAMPLAVRTASGVQCSHSLPDAAMASRFDPSILERTLKDADRRGPDGSAYLMTWGRTFGESEVEAWCDAWSVSCFVIGHVLVEGGVRRMGPNVMALASDRLDGALLTLDLTAKPSIDEFMDQITPLQLIQVKDWVG